ncbi:MAG: hypothetical protein M3Z05_12290 [Gemmatimonadota bacterium]|nr:hypothetical protein [Gemmatimonadota bacterium]
MRRTAHLVALVIMPFCARAQNERRVGAPPLVSPSIGLHYGGPMRTSLALGLLVDVSEQRNASVVVAGEVGQQGNELSVGIQKMRGYFGSGYSVRAVALRTHDEPWKASPNTTYVGAEAHLMIAFGVGGRIGYLRRVTKQVDEHDNVMSFGVLIGI